MSYKMARAILWGVLGILIALIVGGFVLLFYMAYRISPATMYATIGIVIACALVGWAADTYVKGPR